MPTSPGHESTTATTRTRVPRRPPEVRRAQIVTAARELIAERGLAATSVREIAVAAGVSTGTVTYHFAHVGQILQAVLRAEVPLFTEPIVAAARSAPDGRTELGRIVDGMLSPTQATSRHWSLWIDYWAAAVHDPELARWQDEIYRWWRAELARVVARGAADRSLTALDPVEEAAAVDELVALMDGVVVQHFPAGPARGPAQARAAVHAFVERRWGAGSAPRGGEAT